MRRRTTSPDRGFQVKVAIAISALALSAVAVAATKSLGGPEQADPTLAPAAVEQSSEVVPTEVAEEPIFGDLFADHGGDVDHSEQPAGDEQSGHDSP